MTTRNAAIEPLKHPPPTGGAVNTRWTERRERFVAGIMEGKNQTEAALAAGYSVKSAKRQGYGLMCEPMVKAEIERRREAARLRNSINTDTEIAAFQKLETISIERDQMTAAVKAREAISKITGIWPDNRGVTVQTLGDVVLSPDKALEDALAKARSHAAKLRDVTPA